MKTKFGLLSIGSALIILVLACGYANAEISSRHAVPASLQLSIIYPSNGILTPGQSQVVQVAAAIQPSPGTPIHAYLLMLKVRGQNGNALFANSFNPTKANSLASLNMKQLSPGNYTVTAQLQYNGTSVAAPQKYQITKSGSGNFGTPTPTATATVSRTSTPTSTSTRTAIATATPTSTRTVIATSTRTSTSTRTATATPTPTSASTRTATATSTSTRTAIATSTPTSTSTRTATPTATVKVTQTATAKATSTPTASPAPTPSGLCSVMPPQTQLVDKPGNVYTLSGGVVDVNGVADGYSANVKQVVWDGTDIWQYNGSQWYYQSAPCPQCIPGQAGAWTLSAKGPACSGPVPTATATATSAATVTATGAATKTATATATATGGASPTATSTAASGAAVVSSAVAMANSTRIGVNMDIQSQYDGQAYLQNYLDNPGFEQAMLGHVIVVGAGPTSSGFTDSNNVGAFTTGLWNGVTASVRTGASAGATFTITGYTAGGAYTCSCPALVKGDIIGETVTNKASLSVNSGSNFAGGWGINNGDTGITLSTAQAYQGKSSVSFSVADGSTHSVVFGMDSFSSSVGTCSTNSVTFCQADSDCGGGTCKKSPNYPWHPVTGPMQLSAYYLASGTAGTATMTLGLTRSGSSWGGVSHSCNLTQDGAWHQCVFNFTGADKATDTGVLIFSIAAQSGAATGAKIYVDNAYLGSATSPTVAGWRNDVFTTLQTLNPGTLRYMNGQELSSNDTYFEGADYVRGAAADNPAGNFPWTFSLTDMYAMAGALGASPWISIPDLFSDADVNSFAANLCTAFAADGFSNAFVEQSNEDWASGSHTAGGAEPVQYGQLANRNFGLINSYMTSNCSAYAGKVYFIVGGQEGNPGVLSYTTAEIPSDNPQYGADIASYVPAEPEQPTGQTMAQYAALGFSNSAMPFKMGGGGGFNQVVPEDIAELCGGSPAGCKQFLTVYETGNSNQCGPATAIEAWEMSAGWIAAGINAQNWILGFAAGNGGPNAGALFPMAAQNTFNLAEPEFSTSGGACPDGHGTDSALWGIVHDMDSSFGPAFPHMRPIGWAQALLNRAIGGAYHQMNTSAWPGVYGGAFNQNGSWSAVMSNSNSTSVSFSVTFPAGSTLPSVAQTVLYTNGLADNDENSNSVTIGPLPGGIAVSGTTLTVTLPPFSAVALTK